MKAYLKIFGCVAVLMSALVLAGQPPVGPERSVSASQRLHDLFKRHWEFTLRENPLLATSFGDLRYNDQLPPAGLADEHRRAREIKKFLEELQAIPRAALPDEDRINYDIFKTLLEQDLKEYQFKSYLMPITSRTGFHVSFPELYRRVPLKTVKHYEDYIARLRAFKRYTEQHIERMREGLREGYTLPKVVLKGYEDVITSQIVADPEKSMLYEPFKKFPETIPAAARGRLREEGKKAIMTSVVPAYKEFLDFMKNEYVPAARDTVAVADIPNGRAFYEFRVKRFTTLDVTPEEVHAIGLKEVKRIRKEMDAIIRKVGFKGSFKDFIRFLRTDPRFYVNDPGQYLKEISYILKRMDGELPRLFKTLPRLPYGIREIPAYIAPKTTTAYYQPGAPDGSRAGYYYINTYNLKSRPLYEIEALSFHEAVPGHHLQIALQQELKGVPNFRRIADFTAFVEGWALYSEQLGLEVGFYKDPYSNFGRLTYEMWRALRLVVDTGIHYLGWSRQQAIDYMADNSALTLLNIKNEVDRYISWPGQALAYKMGQLKIRELRALAERELGANFDVREFHDVVLGHGAIPLKLLEANVRHWIAQKKASARKAS